MKFCNNSHLATLLLAFFFLQKTSAQNETLLQPQPPAFQAATPPHMWEFGLHAGIAMNWGDVDYVPNWGAGFHVRRAIDYVFSLRWDALYAQLVHEDNNDGSAETTWQSSSIQLLVSLNNLIWNANTNRKVNFYALAGGGLNRFKVELTSTPISQELKALDYVFQSNGDLGAGLAFRLSNRFNIGFESRASILFGNHADRLDGTDRQDSDVLSYTNVRLNFNLGNTEKKAEPLYWVNPMESILKDVTELKQRPSFDLTDTDGDGVIDLLDQDNATPEGADVDTRGLPLDSDNDGVPNFQDEEPYLVEGSRIVNRPGRPSSGSDPNNPGPGSGNDDSPLTTEEDVDRIFDEKMRKLGKDGGLGGSLGAGGNADMVNAFLPIIHFGIDSYKIRYADYGGLTSIAKLMKANAALSIVVTGFTDKTASAAYNNDLSFHRANSAIDHLVNVHGIARSRLLLNFSGENDPLVPATGSNLMNRRVEFRVAEAEDSEQKRP